MSLFVNYLHIYSYMLCVIYVVYNTHVTESMSVYAWRKEYLFFRCWLRSFSPLSLRQNRWYPLVLVCENDNVHCPVKTDPDAQELTAACGLSQRAPAQTWDSLMSLNFSETTCTRQMSVWQTFLKIQSAAWLTVLLQASRAPPAQALTGEGRSWPWAWLWAWPRPWDADHRAAPDQGPPLL